MSLSISTRLADALTLSSARRLKQSVEESLVWKQALLGYIFTSVLAGDARLMFHDVALLRVVGVTAVSASPRLGHSARFELTVFDEAHPDGRSAHLVAIDCDHAVWTRMMTYARLTVSDRLLRRFGEVSIRAAVMVDLRLRSLTPLLSLPIASGPDAAPPSPRRARVLLTGPLSRWRMQGIGVEE